MSLPGSYQNHIQLIQQEGFDIRNLNSKLEILLQKDELIKDFSSSADFIQFNYKSFLGIQYLIEIKNNLSDSDSINYEIKLSKLIQVCIALVIFIAFFSSFEFSGFLWFSIFFTVIFYAINLIVVDKQIQTILKSVVSDELSFDGNEETLTEKQKEWINDKSKCPACGEEITEYDKNCPDCGLKIRDNARPKPYNLSKYDNENIKYHFREKRKDKN